MFRKPSTHRRLTSALFAGIAVYLFVFSAFALYHAYAEDELFHTHACAIGEWVVHHGQAVLTFVAALSAFLRIIYKKQLVRQETPQEAAHRLDFSRGPPFSLSATAS
ncbi:MAG: hypothetical protein ACE5F7_02235 [Nitrospiria bacterium]